MFDMSLYESHIKNGEYACFWCDAVGSHGLISQKEDCEKLRELFYINKNKKLQIKELEME